MGSQIFYHGWRTIVTDDDIVKSKEEKSDEYGESELEHGSDDGGDE